MNNTLYSQQPLIDILNMKSGDQEYIVGSDLSSSVDKSLIKQKFRGLDDYALDLQKYMLIFKNTKKSKPYFNYSGINPTIALNYVLFKTGDDFEKILEKTFKKKAKIKDSVIFWKVKNSSKEKR